MSQAIALVVIALLLPLATMLLGQALTISDASRISYAGDIRAKPVLTAVLGEADPVRECASPSTGYRDRCFRLAPISGTAFLAPPAGAGLTPGGSLCWIAPHPAGWSPGSETTQSGERTLRCVALQSDRDRIEDEPASLPDGGLTAVDAEGGGDIRVLAWTRTATAVDDPFVPAHDDWMRSTDDDLTIYTDAEWMCVRWLTAPQPGAAGALRWAGSCPCPDDPYERRPLPWSLATIGEYGLPQTGDPAGTQRLPVDWGSGDPFSASGRTDLPGCEEPPSPGCAVRTPPASPATWASKTPETATRPPLWMAGSHDGSDPASNACQCDMWLDPEASPGDGGTICDPAAAAAAAAALMAPALVSPAADPGAPVRVIARASMAELVVCRASSVSDRRDGAPHCDHLDRFRIAL